MTTLFVCLLNFDVQVSSNVDLARMSADNASGIGGRRTVSITEASTPLTNIRTMDLLKPDNM